VTDAKAARDALLAAACTATFDGSTSAHLAIQQKWQKVAPNLLALGFGSTDAKPDTISSTGAFLIDRGETSDQLFAFAVTDGKVCAGGVAVIPQAAEGKVSDTRKPTRFVAVDVPSGQACDAETAQKAFRPDSVR
jgi:hypothetical protein